MKTPILLAALVLASAAGAAAQQPRGVVGAYTALRIWPRSRLASTCSTKRSASASTRPTASCSAR